MARKGETELTARYADMLSAMGTEPRLRIVRLLLSAHPGEWLSGRSEASWISRPARCPIIWKS